MITAFLPALRPYLMLIAAAAAFAAGVWIGHGMTAASYQKDVIAEQIARIAAIKQAADAVQAAAVAANQHAEQLEKARAQREIVYRTITKQVDKIVDRPVYRNVCLDDDGLRVINDALRGEAASDTSQPDAAVPGADAAGR
jgi:hypothetical protein